MSAYALILFGAVAQFLPHPPNATPIAALALFGGAYLTRRQAFAVPLAALALSDLVLGFHGGMPFIYGSFALTVLLGIWLKIHKKPGTIAGACLAGSTIFFLVTNFGSWAAGHMYAHTLAGLMQCYAAGIPFFRNTLLGDAFWVAVLFGLQEIALALRRNLAQSKSQA